MAHSSDGETICEIAAKEVHVSSSILSRARPSVVLVGVVALILSGLASGSGGSDAKAGRYESQGGSEFVHFKVNKHDKVQHPEFMLLLKGGPSCLTNFEIKGRDRIGDQGKFKLTDRNSWIKGKFVKRSKVKGKMYGERKGCGSETSTYEARWVSRGWVPGTH